MSPSLWSRIRAARLVRVLLLFGGASWLLLEVADVFIDKLGLPAWVFPTMLLLLGGGLIVVVSTALVQARPVAEAQATDLPSPWEVDLIDLKESVARGRLPHLTWARAILGGVVVFSLLFGGAGVYVLLSERGQAPPGPAEAEAAASPGIAVLPFRVVGPELELWREGMVDLLSTNLDGAAGLRAIDPRGLLSRWRSEFGEGAEPADRATALALARGLGASYAVIGNAVGLGGGVRLTVEVYALSGGDLLGTAQVEGSPDSVLSLVDHLSVEVLRTGLAGEGAELPQLDLSAVTTTSLAALKAYLEGEQKYRRGLFREAADDFSRAVEADSTFALALSRLAAAYGWQPGLGGVGSDYGERAARFRHRLPERAALLLRGEAEIDERRRSSIQTLVQLTRRFPDGVEAWHQLGEAYFHIGPKALQPLAEARAAVRRSLDLDSTFGPAYVHLIEDAMMRQDTAEAARLTEAYRRFSPAAPFGIGADLVQAFLFGDSISRALARAALDTVESPAFQLFAYYTASIPEFSEDAIELARYMLDSRHPSSVRERGHDAIGWAHLRRGRLREAQEAFASGSRYRRGEPAEAFELRMDLLWYLWDRGEISAARRAAELLQRDTDPSDRFYIGAVAADDGRWSDVEEQMQALQVAAAEAESQRAGRSAMSMRSDAQALRSYAALRRGDLDGAIEEFLKPLPGVGSDRHSLLRYRLGVALLERGETREAERYLQSVVYTHFPTPFLVPGEYYLGEVYEALGEVEQARLHYARFVRAWEDCDPELRPWWERGRQALERLTREAA